MPEDFVHYVGLGRVERCRVVTNVLGTEKHAVGQRLQKDARFDQACHRFQTKPAERLNLFTNLAQLRNAIRVKCKSFDAIEVLRTGMRTMSWSQRLPDSAPNTMLQIRVGSRRYWRSGLITHGNLRNRITTSAVLRISKARMVWIQFDQGVTVLFFVTAVCSDRSHVDVVEQYRFICGHLSSACLKIAQKETGHQSPGRLMAGSGNLSKSATCLTHPDSPSPDRSSRWRAGRNSNSSDSCGVRTLPLEGSDNGLRLSSFPSQ